MKTKNNAYSITTENGRIYVCDNRLYYPSITTILSRTDSSPWLAKWKENVGPEEALRISKLATDRGEKVHSYLEEYMNGTLNITNLNQEDTNVKMLVTNMIKELSKHKIEVWAQETPVWSQQLQAAGRLDLVGTWNGIPAIIDFKTSKKKKTISNITDYILQTCFYASAHNEMHGTKIRKAIILIGNDLNSSQLFEVNPFIREGELRQRVNSFYKQYPDLVEQIKCQKTN